MSSPVSSPPPDPEARPQLHAVTEIDPQEHQALLQSLRGRRIGEIVVALGFANVEAVSSAVQEAQRSGKPTGRVLLDRGVLSKDELAEAIAARTQMTFIDLDSIRLEERALRAIDPATAMRYRAVPVKYVDDDTLLVAVSDPSNVLAVDDIALMTGLNARAALTTTEQLDELLSELSRTDMLTITRRAEEAAKQPAESFDTDDASSSAALERILAHAVRQRASDVHFDPSESGELRVRFRIDGIVHDTNSVAPSIAPMVMSRLKIQSGLDISVRHIPQDGRATFGSGTSEVSLRVATLPTVHGEAAAVRILDKKNVPPLNRLGLNARELEVLRKAMHRPHGALLVTGPTGSGKTTTLYAMMAELNVPERAILTIEDPVEYKLSGVKQVQVNVKRGLSFGTGLRTMLRSDPDVLMVGEIRDRETAQIGIEAALTGRLVLSTLHTSNAATAITRLAEMGIERYLVASSVECIVGSRLARVLCEECKTPVHVGTDALRDIGLTGRDLEPFSGFHAVGCPRCGNTGYRGRIGLFEVMEVDDRVREMVIERYPSHEIEDYAISCGMTTLRDSAIAKVRDGVVSLAEAARVTATE